VFDVLPPRLIVQLQLLLSPQRLQQREKQERGAQGAKAKRFQLLQPNLLLARREEAHDNRVPKVLVVLKVDHHVVNDEMPGTTLP
jgi:hypothetical protein